ncbi:MAG: AAA family ATPase, partial [Phycisphaerales bacterium JB047]
MATNQEHFETPAEVKAQCDAFRQTFSELRTEIGKVMVGQQAVVDAVLVCLFAKGNVLLEGVPGLGKTLLVRTLATTLHLPFNRIQFT